MNLLDVTVHLANGDTVEHTNAHDAAERQSGSLEITMVNGAALYAPGKWSFLVARDAQTKEGPAPSPDPLADDETLPDETPETAE